MGIDMGMGMGMGMSLGMGTGTGTGILTGEKTWRRSDLSGFASRAEEYHHRDSEEHKML